jgi:hypothetical protein
MAEPTMLLVTALVNAALTGGLLALPAALRPAPADTRARTLRRLVPLLSVPMMLGAGFLIDKWQVQTVLLLGAVSAALALATLERADAWAATAGAAAMLAGAIAALTTGTLVILPHAVFPGRPAGAVNLGYATLILAALLTPAAVPLLVRRLGEKAAALTLALACLLPAACVACTPSDQFPAAGAAKPWAQLLADPRLVLLLAAVALCAPLEASLAPWVRRYAYEQGQLGGTPALTLAGFWVLFLASRVAAAFLLPASSEAWAVLLLGIIAAVTLGNLVGAYAPDHTLFGVWLAGASCGPLLPTLLGMALHLFAADAADVAALACTAAAVGNLGLLPWIDASRPGGSTRTAMRGATALAVVLFAPSLVLALLT